VHLATGFRVSLLAAAFFSCLVPAQDSRPDVARRLHDLIDQRIEALRAELHRAIDEAMRPPEEILGMKLRPVSEEFRELHRLPQGCGLRVENGPVTIETGNRKKFLVEKGDVLVESNGPIGRASHLRGFGIYGTGKWDGLTLIRKGEWLSWHSSEPESVRRIQSPASLLYPPAPTETASQMLDRLWDDAVKKAVEGDLQGLRIEKNVQESQPARK
jgi:hypothetical protein